MKGTKAKATKKTTKKKKAEPKAEKAASVAEPEPVVGDPGGKSYLSCRSKRTGATGLYPVHWIRRIEE